jgi:hypothetical protein
MAGRAGPGLAESQRLGEPPAVEADDDLSLPVLFLDDGRRGSLGSELDQLRDPGAVFADVAVLILDMVLRKPRFLRLARPSGDLAVDDHVPWHPSTSPFAPG